jgi:hypothetical protein
MIEIVFASDEVSRNAHRELYRFDEQVYIIVTDDLIETITQFKGDPNKLHVSSNWADITRLAVWKPEPKAGDVFFLLRNIGITSEELLPFRDAGIADLFPWLYYGKRMDVLRKICLAAKANVEKHIENKEVRIHCHLTSEETNRIVASSL